VVGPAATAGIKAGLGGNMPVSWDQVRRALCCGRLLVWGLAGPQQRRLKSAQPTSRQVNLVLEAALVCGLGNRQPDINQRLSCPTLGPGNAATDSVASPASRQSPLLCWPHLTNAAAACESYQAVYAR
jgi:hypothetical protein